MQIRMILDNIIFNIFLLVASFYILFKCADYFVESAAGMAKYFNLPKMLVGIIIVGFATTAPEIAVSAQSAWLGHPEIAFGNALGSVIVDDGIALALAAIVSPVAIAVNKDILKTAGIFLIIIDIIAFLLALNGTISRIEGLIFVFLLVCYILFVIYSEKKRKLHLIEINEESIQKEGINLKKLLLLFAAGLAGVILAARLVIHSSLIISGYFEISETVIGLTIVAIGTSLPEISTCIIASVRGHGEIAVGDIIGADILNILWIIGVSATIKAISLQSFTVYFSFISMFIIVGTMLLELRMGYKLTRGKGIILIVLYLIYLFFNYRFYYA